MNGTLYFQAYDGTTGRELWKSDGSSAGTVLVKDIAPGASSAYPYSLTNVNGTLYFQAYDGTTGRELWKSDGSSEGTVLVKDIAPGESGSYPYSLTNVNGTLYFQADNGTNGRELWKSDGIRSDTTLVCDINNGVFGSYVNSIANVNGTLYFQASDGLNGTELWKSNGNSSGTTLVRDINSGIASSSIGSLINVNGSLFFRANDGVHSYQLWKSDGSSGGTAIVQQINITTGGASPRYAVNVNGTLLFRANDAVNGYELWKSDGTCNGTVLVRDIANGDYSSSPHNLINVNGTLFFIANGLTTGSELWKSDGTSSGTVLVKDIRDGSMGSFPSNLTAVNGLLYFRADDGVHGDELWRSDGTSSGTMLVRDIYNGPGGSTGTYPYLMAMNGQLFLTADDGVSGLELWKSDGTSMGTTIVKDIKPGPGRSRPFHLTTINNTLYFSASDGVKGYELWKSDGTCNGTALVYDVWPGAQESFSQEYFNYNGTLLFSAWDGVHGLELWKSNGTSSGTLLVRDIKPGTSHSFARYMTNVNGVVYYFANDGATGYELWKTDGSYSGTVLVRDIYRGGSSSRPSHLTNLNGALYFSANDGVYGTEIWKSDGTSAGTTLANDSFHGSLSSNPTQIGLLNNRLYFVSTDTLFGAELYFVNDTDVTGTSTTFSVTYSSQSGVNGTTLGVGNVVVQRVGFPNYDGRATEVVAQPGNTNGSITVTYRVSAPGDWDATDNGIYQVVLQSGQVKDSNGLAAGAKVLGSFTVNIPDPNVFYVNTTNDTVDANPGDGLALDAQGHTSLRTAIMEANALAEYQTIVIPSGTYRLTRAGTGEAAAATGDLNLTGDLNILGAGSTTIIDGGGLDRLFDIAAGTRVNLQDLTLQNGNAVDVGGGLRITDATVTLTRVTVINNTATTAGGGIYNDGYLTVADSLFQNNVTTASIGSGGGGLYNLRSANISGTTFVNNSTPGGILGVGGGAGILNTDTGTLSVTNSTFSGNQATQGDGGGINNSGSTTLDHVTLSTNGTPNGDGGGVFNDGRQQGDTRYDSSFGANGLGPFELATASGLAFDSSGNEYVADAAAHRVQVYDASGNYLKTIGSLGVGPGRFDTPTRISVDGTNRLLVAEAGNQRLQVFNADGTFAFFITGVTNSVAVDSANNIYVGRNGQVDVYNTSGVRQANLSFSSNAARPFGGVSGLFIDANGNTYIADAASHVVQVYSSAQSPLRTLTPTSGAATFAPQDVSIDVSGRVYVSDSGNDVLQVFSSSGSFVTALASAGSSAGQLAGPTALELGSDGRLRLADTRNHRVQTLTTAGSFVSTFGTNANNVAPRALAVTAAGQVVVADTENHRVQVFDGSGKFLRQFGSLGSGFGQFNSPAGITVDSQGRIVVADTGNNRLQVFSTDGTLLQVIGSSGSGNGQLNNPKAVTTLSDGSFVVADTGNNRIERFNASGNYVSAFGSLGTAAGQLSSPVGISATPTGNLIVSDTGNNRLQVFSSAGAYVTSFGSAGTAAGQLSSPRGLTVDSSGNVFVADSGNQRFEVFQYTSSNSTYSFSYQFGTLGTGSGQFNVPLSIATINGDKLFVSDQGNDRIQIIRSTTAARQFRLNSTLLAGNTAQAQTPDTSDVSGTYLSNGYNFIGISSGGSGFATGSGDLLGTSSVPLDPRLEPLTLRGTAYVQPLSVGSPAIDRGDPATTLTSDQTGALRSRDGNGDLTSRSDIGAYETLGTALTGTVFADSNGNGVADNGETGSPGWTVYVDLNANGQLDSGEPSTTTANDNPATAGVNEAGQYSLANVAAGSYTLRVAPRSGYALTAPTVIQTSVAPTPQNLVQTTRDLSPLSQQPLNQVLYPALAGNEVVYLGQDTSGNSGVFAETLSSVSRSLLTSGSSLPGTAGTLGSLIPSATNSGATFSYNGGNWAVIGPNATNFFGLYGQAAGGTLRTLADGDTTVPGQAIPFSAARLAQSRPIVSGDLVAFAGPWAGSNVWGLYLSTFDGTLTTLADENTSVPGGGTLDFHSSTPTVAFANETFAFANTLTSGQAVLLMGTQPQQLTRLADTTTTAPGGGGLFTAFDATPQVASGRVAFVGTTASRSGLYQGTTSANLSRIVDTSLAIPSGSGNFTAFDNQFAFTGSAAAWVGYGSGGQQGVYTNLTGSITKVLNLSDTINGRTPLQFHLSPQGLVNNHLAVQVQFTDGSQSLVVLEYPVANTRDVRVLEGTPIPSQDFGVRPTPGILQGQLYADDNSNGIFDAGESFLTGWQVYLDANGNNTLDPEEARVTTDSQGRYSFGDLPALSTYRVAVALQSGFRQVTPTADSGQVWSVTLAAGETKTGLNFGVTVDTSGQGVSTDSMLQGQLFIDNDANGRFNTGDLPLGDQPVYLDRNGNRVYDPGVDTLTSTDSSGNYRFATLGANTYQVRIVTPNGYVQSSPRDPQLRSQPLTTTGEQAEAMASGDFNGDGYPDLIVANAGSNNLSLLLNNRAGGFLSALDLPANPGRLNPKALVVGDFNQDQKPDVAVVYYITNNVAIYLNTGNTAAPLAASSTVDLSASANGPRTLATADFDRDGKLDLVVGNELTGKLLVLYGSGNGQFSSPPTSITVPGGQLGLWAGQFTNDLDPDLAISLKNSNQVLVLKNQGNKTFLASTPVTVGRYPGGLAGADFNRDGQLDLAVTNYRDNAISILLGNGSGGFSKITSQAAGIGPTAVVAVDMDNNGDPDLAVANKQASNVSLLRNLGTGVFSAPDNQGVGNLSADASFAIAALQVSPTQLPALVIAKGENNQASLLYNQLQSGSQRVSVTGASTVGGLDFALQAQANAPTVGLALSTNSLAETGGTATLLVTLSNAWGLDVTVDLAYSGAATLGTDYTVSGTQLVFVPGQISATLNITSLNDTLSEINETINVALANVNLGSTSGSTFAPQQVTATILDDDPAVQVNLQVLGSTLAENNGLAIVTATLSTTAGQDVLIPLNFSGSATYNVDYSASSTSLFIPAGANNANLLLFARSDNNSESDESIILTVNNLQGAILNSTTPLTLTIQDAKQTASSTLPSYTLPSGITTSEDTLTYLAGISISDAAVGNSNVAVILSALHGSLSLATTVASGLTSGQISGNGTGTLSLTAPLAALNTTLAANGGLNYLSALNYSGSDALTLNTNDLGNGGAGTPLTALSLLPITVNTIRSTYHFAQVNPTTLQLAGSTGNDSFSLTYTATNSFTLQVNGQSIPANTFTGITQLVFDGRGGNNTLSVSGASGVADNVTLSPHGLTWTGPSFTLAASNLLTMLLVGQSEDAATFTGSSGVDVLYGFADHDQIQTSGTSHFLNGFGSLTVQSGGGIDTAILSGSSGDDTFVGSPTTCTLGGSNYQLQTTGYFAVYAFAGAGGTDTATLNDSSGDDIFGCIKEFASLQKPGAYFYQTLFFSQYTAATTLGGDDLAFIFDSSGDDTFSGTPTQAHIQGPGYNTTLNNYDRVFSFHAFGGSDTVQLSGSSGNDTFTGLPQFSVLSGPGYFLQVGAYSTVTVDASQGGTDTALLYGSSNNDTFTAHPTQSILSGLGYSLQVNAFDQVYADASQGGSDAATLFDSSGNETFSALPGFSSLRGAAFFYQATGFQQVTAAASAGGSDQALLYDSPGDDTLTASGAQAILQYPSSIPPATRVTVNSYPRVVALRLAPKSNDKVTQAAINYVFQNNW